MDCETTEAGWGGLRCLDGPTCLGAEANPGLKGEGEHLYRLTCDMWISCVKRTDSGKIPELTDRFVWKIYYCLPPDGSLAPAGTPWRWRRILLL